MYGRITTLRTTAVQHDEGLRIISEALLPWSRDASGYLGLLRLHNREAETTLVLTLWATREALEASRAALESLGPRAAEASGADLVAIDHYEVTLADVPLPLVGPAEWPDAEEGAPAPGEPPS